MISALLVASLLSAAAANPASAATPRTLRVDYYHSGDATQERFSLDRIVLEPGVWPGNPARPVDDTNLGKYLFEVVDRQTNRVVYSRGFASVYGEWETTEEAREAWRTFHESLRFPAPSTPVQVVLKKRDARNAFREIWSLLVVPADRTIDPSVPPSPGALLEIERHGPSAEKVDFLILGDGYTAAERDKFEKDARRLAEILFTTSPFKERRNDFNVWGLCPPAAESGISRPSTGIYRRSPVGAAYDTFGSERYVLTFENRALRDIAAFAPYELIEILTNSRTYGGGGIFGQYSTVAADSLWSPYLFIHEFAHHFAGLADEYYTSDVAYEPAAEIVEPWEMNVTAHPDRDTLKWRDLVAPGTPLPTPWSKEEFEKQSAAFQKRRREIRAQNRSEDEMDALFREQQKADTKLLGSEKYAGKVGAFEGANYAAKGYYRPQVDCVMFTRDEVGFCQVCRRALEQVIDLYAGR
ncbi:MAG TPA: IgA Peptidase M64 [Thermoanaerobaculia bacterium]|nr:IgA Peptidase M64 [Thermoanaerobaculia bacterium]